MARDVQSAIVRTFHASLSTPHRSVTPLSGEVAAYAIRLLIVLISSMIDMEGAMF